MKYYKNKNKKLKKISRPSLSEQPITQEMDEHFKTDYTIYNLSVTMLKYIYRTVEILISITGIYLVWILFHYVASHLYVKLCVPGSLYGFLLSPFLIATPYCVGLRWVIYNGANTIQNMWILLGTWACSTITIFSSK